MANPGAKLTKVNITFITHDDNKDDDTILNVAVQNKISFFLNQDLAGANNLGGIQEFPDPSTKSFTLPLASASVTLQDITLPVVNIHIQPNGNDRWIFDYVITLTFDDGTEVSSHHPGIILDQNNKDFTGIFNG